MSKTKRKLCCYLVVASLALYPLRINDDKENGEIGDRDEEEQQ